jgi:group I intron endonuclease
MELMPCAGVYLIECYATNKVYVGSSGAMRKRKVQHLWLLRAGRHSSKRLQADFDLHGESAFAFKTLRVVSEGCLLSAEQEFIDQYDAANPDKGYNMSAFAGKGTGAPKKPEEDVLVVVSVRVPADVLDIYKSWGKNKRQRFAAAVLNEDRNESPQSRPLEGGPVAD